MFAQIKNSRKQKGFTLLEVMVALGIAGVSLSTFLSVSTESIYSSTNLQHKIIGQWLAENKASEIRINRTQIAIGIQQDQRNMLKRAWILKTTISQTRDPYVRKILVKVYLKSEPKQSVAKLISYVSN